MVGPRTPSTVRAPLAAWALGSVVLLFAWIATWRGVGAGVVRRDVLELWVHGAQPGWFDWVPFIHPPGYSLFMNTVDTLASGSDADAAALVFWSSAALTLATTALATGAAARWFGTGPAVFVALLVSVSPQNLRPFEHYPLARLLLLLAFVAVVHVLERRGEEPSRRALVGVVGLALLAVEVHLSAWFLLGPLLGLLALRREHRGARVVLIGLLVVFLATTLTGLYGVLEFGVGHKPGRGRVSFEWANPLLLAAVIPCLFVGLRRAAAGLLAFCAITFALQALQIADGSPFPMSLHYFELIGPPVALVVAGTLATRAGAPRWMVAVVALLLVGSQAALFARGLGALFVDPRWILMVFG